MALPTQTIGGLSSGLDTNSIIESLVSIEKTQLTRLETKKENRELYLNAYYSVNSMLKEFLTSVEAITSKSAWNAKTTASSDDSILTATATDAAAVGTHTFRVGQLATSAQYMSGGFASKDNPILPSGAAGQKSPSPPPFTASCRSSTTARASPTKTPSPSSCLTTMASSQG